MIDNDKTVTFILAVGALAERRRISRLLYRFWLFAVGAVTISMIVRPEPASFAFVGVAIVMALIAGRRADWEWRLRTWSDDVEAVTRKLEGRRT